MRAATAGQAQDPRANGMQATERKRRRRWTRQWKQQLLSLVKAVPWPPQASAASSGCLAYACRRVGGVRGGDACLPRPASARGRGPTLLAGHRRSACPPAVWRLHAGAWAVLVVAKVSSLACVRQSIK